MCPIGFVHTFVHGTHICMHAPHTRTCTQADMHIRQPPPPTPTPQHPTRLSASVVPVTCDEENLVERDGVLPALQHGVNEAHLQARCLVLLGWPQHLRHARVIPPPILLVLRIHHVAHMHLPVSPRVTVGQPHKLLGHVLHTRTVVPLPPHKILLLAGVIVLDDCLEPRTLLFNVDATFCLDISALFKHCFIFLAIGQGTVGRGSSGARSLGGCCVWECSGGGFLTLARSAGCGGGGRIAAGTGVGVPLFLAQDA
mmetsp:Transcript_3835/g.9361  ORF Transcript_3835/g.9361 Transcript_3835/m.9361 type:complete len:255 (+) Transcript_3835:679-1443(+)